MRKSPPSLTDLAQRALKSAEQAIFDADAVSAERWLKVARAAHDAAIEEQARKLQQSSLSPQERLNARRDAKDCLMAIIERRMARLSNKTASGPQ